MVLILTYLLEGTALDLFRTGWLRRAVCLLVLLKNGRKDDLFPRPFLFLIIPFISQCLQSEEACLIGLVRSGWWFLYAAAVRALARNMPEYVRLARSYVRILAVLCLIGRDMYSAGGDWTGIWENRNMTVSLMMSGAVYADMLCRITPGRQKLLYRAACFLFVCLAFRTHSRMALVLTAVMVIFRLAVNGRGRLILPGGVLALSSFWVLKKNGAGIAAADRLLFARDGGVSGGLFRDTWLIGLRLFAQRPLLGHGAHTAYYHTFVRNSGGWGWGMHSSWLIILAENGILGGFLLFLFFLDHLLRCRQALRTGGTAGREVRAAGVLMCLMLGVNAMTESFLFSAGNVMSLAFWLSYFMIGRDAGTGTGRDDEDSVCNIFPGAVPGQPAE